MLEAYLVEWGSLFCAGCMSPPPSPGSVPPSSSCISTQACGATPDIAKGGVAWEVHGGGFYEMRKYLVAPDADAGAS